MDTLPSKEQISVFNAYSIISLLTLLIVGTAHIVIQQNAFVGWTEIISGGVLLLNVLLFRTLHHFVWACNVFLFTILALLTILLITGGIQGTGIFWFFIFPITAFLLVGKKQGLRWSIALSACILLVIFLARLLSFTLLYDFIELRQLFVVMTVVTVGLYIYQTSLERLLGQSEANRQNLATEKIKSDAVIDNIGEAVIVTDPLGRITLMNQAAETTFGWQFKALKGKKFADNIPVLDATGKRVADAMRPIQQSIESLKKVSTVAIYARKDGSSFPASVVVTPIVVSKTLLGAVSTIRDISEEQAIDRAKSAFVTLASHQLRTPASAIAWTSELLLSGDIGTLTKEQEKHVGKIYKSNQRLIDLVDDMLTVSSLELGNFALVVEPTKVSSVVHRALKAELKKHGGAKTLHIHESYDDTIPDILTDATGIKSIARRLISNAIKYTPPGGNLTVHLGHSHEKLTPKSKGSLLLEITDTGYGIPERQQAKVFTKLFRADNIKKKDTDGTGLGLYITKALVERMDGKIWFTSEQHKGSRFSVLLPIEGVKES